MWLRFNPEKDALFLDLDGTILDIAPTANDVKVSPQLVKDLKRLHEKLGGALAFISGRTVENIDKLFEPLCFPCSGAHGAEWRLSQSGPIKSAAPLPDNLREKIASSFANMKDVLVEDKSYTVAVHYRQAPEASEEIEQTLVALVNESGMPLVIIRGRKVFEVAQSSHDKGQALERLIETPPFKGRRPIFLGDDITDMSAIGACLKNGGIAARVGQGNPRQNAFASPEAVRSWINKMTIKVDEPMLPL